ncbi:MAG: M20/M25/M40 family metallo-hydrolase [Synergistaceae bacterium]|jgi:arginine utilization protein RocB|nr:M20/M25/M40 family metallo-hydrolase [Synergistaceae bacterium]
MMIVDDELKGRIAKLAYKFVRIYTATGTIREKDTEDFYRDWFESVDYFKKNEDLRGMYAIPGDHLGRSIPWCLVKGSGDATVVLLHHYDVVDTDDYKSLRNLATDPDALMSAFRDGRLELDAKSVSDLENGGWIFGRGTADMKGGASIQMALVERYAQMAEEGSFSGNMLLVGLPDEENLSAGGRSAPRLLKKLKDEHGLRYVLALNAEPNDRAEGTGRYELAVGSIGKIMPLIYARGKLSHAGMVYEGVNPIKIMSKIVEKLDLIPDLIDSIGGIASPAPTFLYLKDAKKIYDVSLPIAASGYMSVMFLKKSVEEIMNIVREKCVEAFNEAIEDIQRSFDSYVNINGGRTSALPWEANVKLYSELHREAIKDSGAEFERAFSELAASLGEKAASGKINLVEASHVIIEHTLRYVRDASPTVIIALTPPYYPVVSNSMLGGKADDANRLADEIIARAESKWGDEYVKYYIVGMSDLSYFMQNPSPGDNAYIEDNMLLWGNIYDIPFDDLDEISMPVMNIGPWGKDIHKYTERVFMEDLFNRTPDLMSFAIERILM